MVWLVDKSNRDNAWKANLYPGNIRFVGGRKTFFVVTASSERKPLAFLSGLKWLQYLHRYAAHSDYLAIRMRRQANTDQRRRLRFSFQQTQTLHSFFLRHFWDWGTCSSSRRTRNEPRICASLTSIGVLVLCASSEAIIWRVTGQSSNIWKEINCECLGASMRTSSCYSIV